MRGSLDATGDCVARHGREAWESAGAFVNASLGGVRQQRATLQAWQASRKNAAICFAQNTAHRSSAAVIMGPTPGERRDAAMRQDSAAAAAAAVPAAAARGPDLSDWIAGSEYRKKYKSGVNSDSTRNQTEFRSGELREDEFGLSGMASDVTGGSFSSPRNFHTALIQADYLSGLNAQQDGAGDFSEQQDWRGYDSNSDMGDSELTKLSSLYRAKKYEEALNKFREMRDAARSSAAVIGGGTVAYNIALASLAKLGRSSEARALSQQMTAQGVRFDMVTYCTLMQAHGSHGEFDQAIALLDQLEAAREMAPTAQLFNVLLSVAFRTGAPDSSERIEAVARVLGEIRAAGLVPDGITLSTLVNGLRRCGRLPQAFQLLHELRALGIPCNVFMYNGLIFACTKAGRLDDALKLYKQLQEDGLEPDRVTFADLLSACATAQRPDYIEQLMENMRTFGLQPDEAAYAALIEAHGQARRLNLAFSAFREMQRELQGQRPTLLSFSALIGACAKCGATDLAFGLLGDMRRAGVLPDNRIYLSLIDACGKRRDLDRGLEVLDLMKQDGIAAKTNTFNSLINAAGAAQRLDAAFDIFAAMQRAGVEPDSYTHNVLISACAASRESERAFEVLREMEATGFAPDAVTYNTLIKVCGQERDLPRALDLFGAMRARGIEPTRITFNGLLTVCNVVGDVAEAMRIFGELRATHRPDAVSFNVILELLARDAADEDAFLDVLRESQRRFCRVRLGHILLALATRSRTRALRRVCAPRAQPDHVRLTQGIDRGMLTRALRTLLQKHHTRTALSLALWAQREGNTVPHTAVLSEFARATRSTASAKSNVATDRGNDDEALSRADQAELRAFVESARSQSETGGSGRAGGGE